MKEFISISEKIITQEKRTENSIVNINQSIDKLSEEYSNKNSEISDYSKHNKDLLHEDSYVEKYTRSVFKKTRKKLNLEQKSSNQNISIQEKERIKSEYEVLVNKAETLKSKIIDKEIEIVGHREKLWKVILKEYFNDFEFRFKNVTLIVMLITIGFFTYNPNSSFISSLFAPLLGIILGLTCIFNLFIIIYSRGRKYKYPLLLTLIFWILFCTKFNNNHNLRTIDSNNALPEREDISSYISNWIEKKRVDGTLTDSLNHIYLISAEGGGIRSAFWTSNIINKIESDFKLFDKTIALSGVSGGSIGIAVSSIHMKNKKAELNKVFDEDLITPTITGLLFPEVLQKLIPKPFKRWDRTRRLEDTWSKAVSTHILKNGIDNGLLAYWNGGPAYHLPAIFFNTTKVEDGRKAIISNIKLDEAFQCYDIVEIMDKDIPIKSAAMASARFPFVTPPGKILNKENEYWGNLVDGGYFDNSGLHTTFQIVKSIADNDLAIRHNIKPIIIYLKNSRESESGPSNLLLETSAPLKTFINSWDARVDYYVPDLEALTSKYNFDLITFQLNNEVNGKELEFPLAWSFSNSTKQEMESIILDFAKVKPIMSQIENENLAMYLKLSSYAVIDRE